VTCNLLTNSSVALTPIWSGTPSGAIFKCGMDSASSSGSSSIQPFWVSLLNASAKKVACSVADLRLPLLHAICKSLLQTFSDNDTSGKAAPFSNRSLNVHQQG
jgi:hypothetical protein